MKKTFLLPIAFILIFLAVLSVLTAFYLFYIWGISYNPEGTMQSQDFKIMLLLPGALGIMLPISIISSLFLLLGYLLKHPGNRFLSALLPFITGLLVYYGGFIGIEQLNRAITSDTGYQYTHSPVLLEGNIHRIHDGFLYIESMQQNQASLSITGPIVFIPDMLRVDKIPADHDSALTGKIRFYKTGRIDPESRQLVAGEHGKPLLAVQIEPANPFFMPMFQPSESLENFFGDAALVFQTLLRYRTTSLILFVMTLIVHTALAIGCWGIIRLSRWPLFNGFLVLVIFRGFFLVQRVTNSTLFAELGSIFTHPLFREGVSTFLLAAIALPLLLFTMFFAPYRTRDLKKDRAYG